MHFQSGVFKKDDKIGQTVTLRQRAQKDPSSRSREGLGLEPRILGERLLPGLVSDGIGDGAVELQSHSCRLMPESLCNRLRVHSSSGHGEAETVTHRMRVLLGNVESSGLSGLAEPLVEETTTQRLLRVPL